MKFNYYVYLLFFNSFILAKIDIKELCIITQLKQEDVQNHLDALEKLQDAEEKSWGGYHEVFPRLINQLDLKVGCEVGVSCGLHSKRILQETKVSQLYSIDPYLPFDGFSLKEKDPFHEIFYYRVKDMLSEFAHRSILLRKTSVDAAKDIEDCSLDFAFIDANHQYEFVLEDLHIWYNKIRSGGLFGGDDYATVWPGVPQAVNLFFKEKNLMVNLDKVHPRVWWVIKP